MELLSLPDRPRHVHRPGTGSCAVGFRPGTQTRLRSTIRESSLQRAKVAQTGDPTERQGNLSFTAMLGHGAKRIGAVIHLANLLAPPPALAAEVTVTRQHAKCKDKGTGRAPLPPKTARRQLPTLDERSQGQ